DRFAFLGARSSANFCQEDHLAKVDLQMVLIPQESKRSASASRIFYTEITEQIFVFHGKTCSEILIFGA
ncbi:hypothetical protein, partial [Oceanobacillus sojae]|uniref:hypothetical protein n=1 Tax=Oceanobacillus sojae TaxID=582851 RepID=UPI001C378A33